VPEKEWLEESDLASLAMWFRKAAKKTRAQAARELGVAQTSIFHAEESPKQSLFKLRSRMIEAYSPYKVASRIVLIAKQPSKRKRSVQG
jgi:DNA-binding XRE family transcriptional regulator